MRVGGWLALLATVALSWACRHPVPPVESPPQARVEEGLIVQLLRNRPVPNPTQARFSIKMHSKPLKIIAPRLAGTMVVDRPDRAYVAVLDPLGAPVIELATDGSRVAFVNNRDNQFIVQDDARASLGNMTLGAITLPDVVGMLTGLLPIVEARVREEERMPDGLQRIVFVAPQGIVVTAFVDAETATPRRVEVEDGRHVRVLEAIYDPFVQVEGGLLPARVQIWVPKVELSVDVEFKVWKPIETAPEVFSPQPRPSYEVIPFAEYVQRMRKASQEGPKPTLEPAP